jgi:hypothetical protein
LFGPQMSRPKFFSTYLAIPHLCSMSSQAESLAGPSVKLKQFTAALTIPTATYSSSIKHY